MLPRHPHAAPLAALAIVFALAAPARAAAPVAVLSGPAATSTSAQAGYDASASTDPDGGPVRFAWSIDGEDLDVDDPWLSVQFAHTGAHVVAVTVSDPVGDASTASQAVAVSGTDVDPSTLSPFGSAFGQGVLVRPRLTVAPAAVRVRLRGRRLPVRMSCRGTVRCVGTLRAVALVGPLERPLLLAGRSFSIPAGRRATLQLRLGRAARRHLRRHPKVRVTAYRGRVRAATTWATVAYHVPRVG